MSTIEHNHPLTSPKKPRAREAFANLEYQPVHTLEELGWEVVSTVSVDSHETNILLKHARESTPEKIFDGPILAVGPDGRYYCMRKKKASFASYRQRAEN
jgi:hypothetical protein